MNYFEKHALFPVLISREPAPGLLLCVTIPCYDEDTLLPTLIAIRENSMPDHPVEVIVLINSSDRDTSEVIARNDSTYAEACAWALKNECPGLQFHILQMADLPFRHAGVGLARKIAMDEAARRLPPEGVITCLDADTLVQTNYLRTIAHFFVRHPECRAAGIYYEHPLEGDAHPSEVYEAITAYELHLRYYVHALRWAGWQSATQTIGSAMAVRAGDYMAQGGMNRRKAGEDFYFLHKFTPLGGFGEITATTVIPSPRISHRVPFGTGKAIGDMLTGKPMLTYAPVIFDEVKVFLDKISEWYLADAEAASSEKFRGNPDLRPPIEALPPAVSSFLMANDFYRHWREMITHTASRDSFVKRFFRWFDPFMAMKYVHYARDHFYPGVPVMQAAATFLGLDAQKAVARDLLLRFREKDRFNARPGEVRELE